MSEHSGYRPLWTEAKYPGDSVRELALHRRGELGSIRIQQIRPDCVKVCSFLPGEVQDLPGDTPKVWPEKSEYITNSYAADELFDRYVQEAYGDFWFNYHPEQHR